MGAETTAVLFVECQNGLLGEDSVLPAIAEAASRAIPAMARLADGARATGARVVHLTYVPAAGNRSLNRRPPLFRGIAGLMDGWQPDDPATRPIDAIGVGPDDLVLPRHTGLSPTYGGETFKLLRNIGIRTIVVAGISLNIAIPVVATEAVDEDFDVVIPRDAVAGSPPEHAESVLRHTLPFIARLTTVDELLTTWGVATA